jgi:hypothetical protein
MSADNIVLIAIHGTHTHVQGKHFDEPLHQHAVGVV